MELPDSIRRQIEQLPLDRQEDIVKILQNVETWGPLHLAPFGHEEDTILLRDQLVKYRPDLAGGDWHLASCHGGGYRFFFLNGGGDVLFLMAMAPRPNLLVRR